MTRERREFLLMLAIALTIALGFMGYMFRTPEYVQPKVSLSGYDVEDVRRGILATVDEFRLMEVQRFVPPAPIIAPDQTVSGYKPQDAYSLTLDSETQRLWDIAHQFFGPAMTDIATARDDQERLRARRRAFAACQQILQILRRIPTDEWNEETYVRRIGAEVLTAGMMVKVNE